MDAVGEYVRQCPGATCRHVECRQRRMMNLAANRCLSPSQRSVTQVEARLELGLRLMSPLRGLCEKVPNGQMSSPRTLLSRSGAPIHFCGQLRHPITGTGAEARILSTIASSDIRIARCGTRAGRARPLSDSAGPAAACGSSRVRDGSTVQLEIGLRSNRGDPHVAGVEGAACVEDECCTVSNSRVDERTT